jgi:hypothetical protein
MVYQSGLVRSSAYRRPLGPAACQLDKSSPGPGFLLSAILLKTRQNFTGPGKVAVVS